MSKRSSRKVPESRVTSIEDGRQRERPMHHDNEVWKRLIGYTIISASEGKLDNKFWLLVRAEFNEQMTCDWLNIRECGKDVYLVNCEGVTSYVSQEAFDVIEKRLEQDTVGFIIDK